MPLSKEHNSDNATKKWHFRLVIAFCHWHTCKLLSDDVWPKASPDKLSTNDWELDTGLPTGLFFWSLLSFSLPETFDPSQLLPLNVCLKPPKRFRFGLGELSEDAEVDLVPHFELSAVDNGPDDDFGNRDIFLPEDDDAVLLDLPCDLLSTGKLEISGAELKYYHKFTWCHFDLSDVIIIHFTHQMQFTMTQVYGK